jgi:hypothetical protein
VRPHRVEGTRTTRKFPMHCFKYLLALIAAQISMMVLGGIIWVSSSDDALAVNGSISGLPNRYTWSQDHSRKRHFLAPSERDVKETALDEYSNHPNLNLSLEHQPAILILGGSDGSGTRAFVQHLIQLGIPMIYDDEITMDVHGRSMSDGDGWPQIVRMVLDSVHSANYNVSSLPDNAKEIAVFHLTKLKKELTRKFDNRFRDGARVKSGVLFGFKAPVTMLLLPILKEVFGNVKFLHVVRDGRDVALSANQSPVKKFYNFYYKDYIERRRKLERPEGEESLENVFAMQLWNDWNTEVREWAQAYAGEKSFEYLMLRTEDLVDPNHKLDSLLHLATFVGLRPSPTELCCMLIKDEKDMGLSVNVSQRGRPSLYDGFGMLLRADRGPTTLNSDFSRDKVQETRAVKRERLRRERLNQMQMQTKRDESDLSTAVASGRRRLSGSSIAASKLEQGNEPTSTLNVTVGTSKAPKLSVQRRYGRWATTLQNRTDLSLKLHVEGAVGLKAFGYEPASCIQQQHPDLLQVQAFCQNLEPIACSS